MSLLFSFANRIVPISEGQRITIGRSSARTGQIAGNHNLFFDNPVISRKHAVVYRANDNLYIEDSGSTHGTKYSTKATTALDLQPHRAQLLSDKGVLHLGADVVRDTEVHKKISGTITISHGPVTPPQEAARSKRHSYGLSFDEEEANDYSSSSDDTSSTSSHKSSHITTTLGIVLVEDSASFGSPVDDERLPMEDVLEVPEVVSTQTQSSQDIVMSTDIETVTLFLPAASEDSIDLAKLEGQTEVAGESESLKDGRIASSVRQLFESAVEDQARVVESPEKLSQDPQSLNEEAAAATEVATSTSSHLVVDLDSGVVSVVDDCGSVHWDDSESAYQSDSDDEWPSEYESKLVDGDYTSSKLYNPEDHETIAENYCSGSIQCINQAFSESSEMDNDVKDYSVENTTNLVPEVIVCVGSQEADSDNEHSVKDLPHQQEGPRTEDLDIDQLDCTPSNDSAAQDLLEESSTLKDVVRQLQAAIETLQDEADCRSASAKRHRRTLTRSSRMNADVLTKLKELWSKLSQQDTLSSSSHESLLAQFADHFENLSNDIADRQENLHVELMSQMDNFQADMMCEVAHAVEEGIIEHHHDTLHDSKCFGDAMSKHASILEQVDYDLIDFKTEIKTLPQRLLASMQARQGLEEGETAPTVDLVSGPADTSAKATKKRSSPDSGFDDAKAIVKKQARIEAPRAWPQTVKHVALGVMLGAGLTFAGLANIGSSYVA